MLGGGPLIKEGPTLHYTRAYYDVLVSIFFCIILIFPYLTLYLNAPSHPLRLSILVSLLSLAVLWCWHLLRDDGCWTSSRPAVLHPQCGHASNGTAPLHIRVMCLFGLTTQSLRTEF